MWRAGTCWIQQWPKSQHLAQGPKDPGETEVGIALHPGIREREKMA